MASDSQNPIWQQFAGAMVGALAQHADNKIAIHQNMTQLVAESDTVIFDFSTWTYEGLNEGTTSLIWGIPPGTLEISSTDVKTPGQFQTSTLTAQLLDTESGQMVVYLYKWCVSQATAAGSFNPEQRLFRFEHGRYSGSWAVPSFGMAARYFLEGMKRA